MITKIKKTTPKDSIKMECGFGCMITIETVDSFSLEEKKVLVMKEYDAHGEIFHGFKPKINIDAMDI